ncbi:MAG: hypothetical protein AAGG51_07620 [Cyanobacteria bacterium P01_G01_bin.54]
MVIFFLFSVANGANAAPFNTSVSVSFNEPFERVTIIPKESSMDTDNFLGNTGPRTWYSTDEEVGILQTDNGSLNIMAHATWLSNYDGDTNNPIVYLQAEKTHIKTWLDGYSSTDSCYVYANGDCYCQNDAIWNICTTEFTAYRFSLFVLARRALENAKTALRNASIRVGERDVYIDSLQCEP